MSSTSADVDRRIGETIANRYEVVRRIGKGGMGAVYEVRHLRLNRIFALKTIAEDLANNTEALARFRREADIIARLRHPNIVEIVDWEQLDDGSPCIVMELLRGESLKRQIKRQGPLAWETIAQIGDQLSAALSVAHRADVVHRDLKPENIFLSVDDGGEARAKLLDFGVSKVHNSTTIATADERLLGTPAYMAPEQADGAQDQIGPATDVWALGAILFEMATGVPAFDAPSVPSILYKICHGEPRVLTELRPDAPPAFAKVLADAMSRSSRRIRRSDTLRVRLRAALSDVPGVKYTDTLDVDINDLHHDDGLETTLSSTVGESILTEGGDKRRRWWPSLLIGAGAIAAGAIAFVALSGRGQDVAVEPTPASTPGVAAEVSPPMQEPEPAATPTPAADVESETITVSLSSTPPGAVVYRVSDGVRLGETPFENDYPRGDGVAELRLLLPKFEPVVLELSTTENHDRHIELVAIRPPATAAKSVKSSKRNSGAASRVRTRKKASKKGRKKRDGSGLGDRTVDPFGRGK